MAADDVVARMAGIPPPSHFRPCSRDSPHVHLIVTHTSLNPHPWYASRLHASDRIGRLFRSMPAAHFGAAGRDRSPGAQAPGPHREWDSGGRPTGPKRAADMAEMRKQIAQSLHLVH